MAVAHSSASESHTGTIGSTSQTAFTWTHTQTGTPQGVLVFVHVANSGGNPVSSVTYGSVTLTRVSGGAAVDAAGELGRTDLFFAGSGLASGNQTITVNRANTTDIMYASAATVTAATNTNVTGIVLLEGDGTMAQQSVDDGTPGTNSLRYAAAYSGLNAPPTTGANSTSLTSIDFGNYTAAMVRETTAGQGARLVGFTTATDDRAAVHVAVRELWNRTDNAVAGAFTLTGPANTLTRGRSMTGDVGSFTLTGQPADLRHNPDIDAGVGSFTLAGQPASTLHNPRLDGGVGSFTLAGQPAATLHNPRLDGGVGSFTLTGQSATLSKTTVKSITTETGAFALNGGAPSLLKARLRLSALDLVYLGKPFAFIEARPLSTKNLDTTYLAQPFVGAKTEDYISRLDVTPYTFTGNNAVFTKSASALSVYTKIAGTWKQASAMYVNVGGTWKAVTTVSTNVSGTWKA